MLDPLSIFHYFLFPSFFSFYYFLYMYIQFQREIKQQHDLLANVE